VKVGDEGLAITREPNVVQRKLIRQVMCQEVDGRSHPNGMTVRPR
jgi:hypothetical protein